MIFNKRNLILFICYFLLSFSLFYTTYKRYDINKFTWDSYYYMEMKESLVGNSVKAPWKYRVLTPLLVRGTEKVFPFYNTEITADIPLNEKRTMYYFMLTNYIFLIFTCVLFFNYLKKKFCFSDSLSFLGGLMLMYSFNTVVQVMVPYVDAGLYFFVVLLLLLQLYERSLLFFLVSILGVFQKESVILIVGLILGLDWVFYKSMTMNWVKWLLMLIPSGFIYIALKILWPEVDVNNYDVLHGVNGIFNTARYTKSFFFQSFLVQLPLFFAVLAHFWIRFKKGYVEYPMKLLFLFPMLYIIPFIFGITIGRFVSYGFPVFISYELAVLKGVCFGRYEQLEN